MITAWKALVWAYRDENVRAASFMGEVRRHKGPRLAATRYEGSGDGGGLINGVLEPHEDALAIDAMVANWFEDWPLWRQGAAVYAEKAELPPHPDSLAPFHIAGPEINAKGNIRVLYNSHGRKDEGYLCPLVVDGFEAAEIQRHREFHALFHELLNMMPGLLLKRWKIAGKGC